MGVRSLIPLIILLSCFSPRRSSAAVIYASGFDNTPLFHSRLFRYDTVANTGSQYTTSPAEIATGIDIGPDGLLYVGANDISTFLIRVNPQTGEATILVERFDLPLNDGRDVALGPDQNLYVGNAATNSVLKYSITGQFLGTFISGDPGTNLLFAGDGKLYISGGATVRRYSATTGAFLDAFVASSTGLTDGTGIGFGPDGNFYVADRTSNSVVRFNGQTGAFIDTFITTGTGGLRYPTDLLFAPDGLYVAQEGPILRYDASSGAFLGQLDPTNTAGAARAFYLALPERSAMAMLAMPLLLRRRRISA